MYRVVSTKAFAKCLQDLRKHGKPGKAAETAARAAMQYAGEHGEVNLARTKHGEDRLPNIEKYDIENNAFRLIVQLIDGQKKERAFLFVGDHESADLWLKNHRGYKWVRKASDNTLEFVQVTEPNTPHFIIPQPNISVPDSFADLHLLRGLSDDQWSRLQLSNDVVNYARRVTMNAWEADPQGVIDHIRVMANDKTADLFTDLLFHAQAAEWEKLDCRLQLAFGEAEITTEEQAAAAMADPVNSEQFLTWDEDFKAFPEDFSWAEWLLFLNPQQKGLARQDFSAAARLRGVSGSGKTCVCLHRARYLARKYGKRIMLATLTESMRKLLDALIRDLCGVEQSLISTTTVNSFAEKVIDLLHPSGLNAFTRASSDQLKMLQQESVDVARESPDFGQSQLANMTATELFSFLDDELTFVRSRLLPNQYDNYLDSKKVIRRGRGAPLREQGRKVCLAALRHWDEQLRHLRLLDHERVAQIALALAKPDVESLRTIGLTDEQIRGAMGNLVSTSKSGEWYRSLLVDEVQDLSQTEISLLAHLPASKTEKRFADCENGLFLVGDGAQTIYRRGFSLRAAGVEVANRSYVLKKNYRNTREILTAAFSLVQRYEFADVDEDNFRAPTEPDLPKRHGERPLLVKCQSLTAQLKFAGDRISEILTERQQRDEYEDLSEPTVMPICIIGMSPATRAKAQQALRDRNIPAVQMYENSAFDGSAVKISTIESAKGHEFYAVFIIDLIEGVIPHGRTEEDDLPREASRLYVAMTRASELLYLTYTAAQGTRPSQFLTVIQNDCTETEYNGYRLAPISE